MPRPARSSARCVSGQACNRSVVCRTRRRYRLWLEQLEDRLALGTVLSDGGAIGSGTIWSNPANWMGDQLPGIADDAVIGNAFTGQTITSSEDVVIKSLTSKASLVINGGTFTVAALQSSANLTLQGGTLK